MRPPRPSSISTFETDIVREVGIACNSQRVNTLAAVDRTLRGTGPRQVDNVIARTTR